MKTLGRLILSVASIAVLAGCGSTPAVSSSAPAVSSKRAS